MMGRGKSSHTGGSCYSSNDLTAKSLALALAKNRFTTSLAAAASCLLFNQASFAQSMETPVQRLTQGLSERIEFDVERFTVSGENPLSEAATQAILAPYLGSNRGIDDIENAADALEQVLIEKGLSFYRVSFPPQELTDKVVDLLITRYKIGKINVKGNRYYSNKNIESSLPVLRQGSSPSTKGIARGIRIANQSGGKRVRVSLAPGDGDNEIDANVTVVDQRPMSISSWINNTGTDSSGDFRVGASVSHRNLFGLDHNASLTFITSPEGVDDLQQFAASYRVPLYSLGGSVNFVAVNSNVDSGVVADVFDVAGRGEVYGVGYSHVLSTIGSYNHGLSVQIQDKLFDNDVEFQGQQILEDVRSRPLSLSYQASWNNWSGSVSATSNLSGGSFNDAQFYNLSRTGASDDWTKVDLGLGYQYKQKEWLYTAALSIAISSDRLITGEQFAVGGAGSVRGLDERELRGDEGYQLNLQAWAPPTIYGIRPVAFIDLGYVSNNDPIESEFSSEEVVSIGLLLNWNPTGRISTSASYGFLIDGIDNADPTASAPEDGDGKFHFNLTYRF